ncbi:MAG: hypothetical protein KDB58_07255 [Solirubrobacterales bacterium]|nr:hypothetical protein [Solirubrobacterales bacterium]MCB9617788.1 hypothetical protein [Sandaracinus sp.]
MQRVFINEPELVEGSPREVRAERHTEMPRVPVAGERIEGFPDGIHTVWVVTAVTFKEGDDPAFHAVVDVREEL